MANASMPADRWQIDFFNDTSKRTLLLASRQSGKSQAVTAKVLAEALHKPKSLILLLSPTLRQSGELFRERLLPLWRASGSPLALGAPTQLELRLSNGSRIVSLPDSESGIRGFSGVTHLVVDEAARVSDELYKAVRPFLAVRNGSLTCLSTPFGQRGFFYEAHKSDSKWHKIKVVAADCPRLTPEFLAEERIELGDAWYLQEYECNFASMIGCLWDPDLLTDKLFFDDYPGEVWVTHRVLAIDPSKGEKETSDWQAFVLVTLYSDGSFWVECRCFRLDDLKLYHKAIELIDLWKPEATVVETASSGYVLFNQLGRAGKTVLGRTRPSTQRKYDRISIRLTGLWGRRLIHIKKDKGGRELLSEAQQWPSTDAHDDCLDALEGGIELCGQLILPKGHHLRFVRYQIFSGSVLD